MAAYVDLDPLPYFGSEHGEHLRAIGWLAGGIAFRTGPVAPEFVERIKELLASAYEPVKLLGFHQCDLCQFDGPHGGTNLFVPGAGILFVMPELAVHYMAAHHYQPPTEFQEAVLGCPAMASMDYRRAFLENGGRGLV